MTVFTNGGPSITADNANQWVQAWDTVADLRGQIGTVTIQGVPQQVSLQGFTSPGDNGQGIFYWNANSIAADDGGVTTVVPSGSPKGAWVRIPPPNTTVGVTTSSVQITATGLATVVASVVLPLAGSWIIAGNFSLTAPTGTTIVSAQVGISTSSTTITFGSIACPTGMVFSAPGNIPTIAQAVPTLLQPLSAQTIYMVALVAYSGASGNLVIGGSLLGLLV